MTSRFLLALVLLSVPATGAAQDLQPIVGRVASWWQRGNTGALADSFAEEGVTISLGAARTGTVSARQAAAMLRRLFEERETVSVRVGRARIVGGEPSRAFAELDWTARARGTTIPVRETVFLALLLEDGNWRITEIRLMK